MRGENEFGTAWVWVSLQQLHARFQWNICVLSALLRPPPRAICQDESRVGALLNHPTFRPQSGDQEATGCCRRRLTAAPRCGNRVPSLPLSALPGASSSGLHTGFMQRLTLTSRPAPRSSARQQEDRLQGASANSWHRPAHAVPVPLLAPATKAEYSAWGSETVSFHSFPMAKSKVRHVRLQVEGPEFAESASQGSDPPVARAVQTEALSSQYAGASEQLSGTNNSKLLAFLAQAVPLVMAELEDAASHLALERLGVAAVGPSAADLAFFQQLYSLQMDPPAYLLSSEPGDRESPVTQSAPASSSSGGTSASSKTPGPPAASRASAPAGPTGDTSIAQEDHAKIRAARLRKLQGAAADSQATGAPAPSSKPPTDKATAVPSSKPQLGLNVCSLSWNSTGNVVAVGYGKLRETGWYTSSGFIHTWNIHSRQMREQQPAATLDVVSSYPSAMAFHPDLPSILAVGTYNGEVALYDISLAESGSALLAASKIEDRQTHREAVSGLVWLRSRFDVDGQAANLVSCSDDGKILLWAVSPFESAFRAPLASMFVGSHRSKQAGVGIASLGFLTYGDGALSSFAFRETSFVVGGESGILARCSLGKSSAPAPCDNFAFGPHLGPVFAVDGSPFHRNIFLTCGFDGEFRVYSALRRQPLLSLSPNGGPLLDCAWSPTRPMVFAVACADGRCLLFDLSVSRAGPVCVLDGSRHGACFSVRFNRRQPEVVATGHGDGQACIWKIGDGLVTSTDIVLEQAAFGDMGDALASVE